jgi:hypothetical protein
MLKILGLLLLMTLSRLRNAPRSIRASRHRVGVTMSRQIMRSIRILAIRCLTFLSPRTLMPDIFSRRRTISTIPSLRRRTTSNNRRHIIMYHHRSTRSSCRRSTNISHRYVCHLRTIMFSSLSQHTNISSCLLKGSGRQCK